MAGFDDHNTVPDSSAVSSGPESVTGSCISTLEVLFALYRAGVSGIPKAGRFSDEFRGRLEFLAAAGIVEFAPTTAEQTVCRLATAGHVVVHRLVRHVHSSLFDLNVTPKWFVDRRELWFHGQRLKVFKRPAPNQELLLQAFEESSWPFQTDDPQWFQYQVSKVYKRWIPDDEFTVQYVATGLNNWDIEDGVDPMHATRVWDVKFHEPGNARRPSLR